MKATCKLPQCNDLVNYDINMCDTCLRASVLRFMHAEGTRDMNSTEDLNPAQKARAAYWIKFIRENIDTLLQLEQENINNFGKDYNRNEEHSLVDIVLGNPIHD